MNKSSSIPRSLKYRADIDGLRAIAVLAVVLFHFFPRIMPGGFVGVDIFFVISGYLVTQILHENIKQNQFSFSNFYYKRIRRLFPSLVLVLFFTFIAGVALLFSDELLNLGKNLISASTFTSNFLFFSESGYFDKSSELKPLLHLWSLCIEEQFYLLWPFVIWFFYNKKNHLLKYALLSILLASLLFNLLLTKNHQAFSFYLIFTRLWELAIGCIYKNPRIDGHCCVY